MRPVSLASAMPTVWPAGTAKEHQVKNIFTCTARAQCTLTPYHIRHQVGIAKVYTCAEYGVLGPKFP